VQCSNGSFASHASAVDEFSTHHHLISRIASGGKLNAPGGSRLHPAARGAWPAHSTRTENDRDFARLRAGEHDPRLLGPVQGPGRGVPHVDANAVEERTP